MFNHKSSGFVDTGFASSHELGPGVALARESWEQVNLFNIDFFSKSEDIGYHIKLA